MKSKHEAKRVEAGVKDRRREISHSAQPIQTTRMERGRAIDAFMCSSWEMIKAFREPSLFLSSLKVYTVLYCMRSMNK